jgi:hypothetical protein
MNGKYNSSGKPSGFQYDKPKNPSNEDNGKLNIYNNGIEMEDDLIIEDNTVYEIDRECFERLKRQRRKR